MPQKSFTIEEARALLPGIRRLLTDANAELSALHCDLVEANLNFRAAEERLDSVSAQACEGPNELRQQRDRYQTAIDELGNAQRTYVERLQFWIETLSQTGVILRDIHEGLLDFPSRQGDFHYFLCWKLSDPDITHWHLPEDGFVGRKPLAVLMEYC